MTVIHIAKFGEEEITFWEGNARKGDYRSAKFGDDPDKAKPLESADAATLCREALENVFPGEVFLVGHRLVKDKEKH